MKNYFINATWNGHNYLCVITEKQRNKYIKELKARDLDQYTATFYNDIDVKIEGKAILDAVVNAKEMTDKETATIRKFIPDIIDKFELVIT